MKVVLFGALVLLAGAGPVFPQDKAAPTQQVEQPEWQILFRQAIATFNTEFSRAGDGDRNYKPVFKVLDQAERAATRQFGAGSDPRITVLHQRAVYLGLAGFYDKQLQTSNQLLKLRTAGVEPQSLAYAKALLLQSTEVTHYNDEHKLFGAKAILKAWLIIEKLGAVKTDEFADVMYLYATQMVAFGWSRDVRMHTIEDTLQFRSYQNPIDTDDYIEIYRMSAGDLTSVGDIGTAGIRYEMALVAAENDSRPEKKHLGRAQVEYGEALLKMGDPAKAEVYLARGVDTLTKPGSNAWPQYIQYAQGKLAEAKVAKVEKLAKLEAKRRQAAASAATEASQKGQIVSTPVLAKILERLRVEGVGMGKAGASK